MRAIAEAITQCKFEATDPAADEVVLYNILQVRQLVFRVSMLLERTHPDIDHQHIAMMFSAPSICLLRCLRRLINVCMLHTICMSIDMNPGIPLNQQSVFKQHGACRFCWHA